MAAEIIKKTIGKMQKSFQLGMISLLIALAPITAAFACNVGTTVSPFRHEVLHIRRQKQCLIDIPGAKILAHSPSLNQTRSDLNSDYSDRLLELETPFDRPIERVFLSGTRCCPQRSFRRALRQWNWRE
jgi:hypothetical protein